MSSELFNAITQCDIRRLAQLLEHGVDPNTQDSATSWRPLEAVIEEGIHYDAPAAVVIEIVRMLLQHGAEVNFRYDDRKLTPLLAAVSWPNRELSQVLLEAGANPNVFNEDDCTPLMLAVKDSDIELAASLLRHSATKTINKCSGLWNRGALHIAVEELDVPMVKLLLEAGADRELHTDDGDNPRSFLPPRGGQNSEPWDAVVHLLAKSSLGSNR